MTNFKESKHKAYLRQKRAKQMRALYQEIVNPKADWTSPYNPHSAQYQINKQRRHRALIAARESITYMTALYTGFSARYEDWDPKKIRFAQDDNGQIILQEFWEKNQKNLRLQVPLDEQGQMNGLALEWNKQGLFDAAIHYKHGEAEGLYISGHAEVKNQTQQLGFHHAGRDHGYRFKWLRDGNLLELAPFDHGDLQGVYRRWDENTGVEHNQTYQYYKPLEKHEPSPKLYYPALENTLPPDQLREKLKLSSTGTKIEALSRTNVVSPLLRALPEEIQNYIGWMHEQGYAIAMPSAEAMKPRSLQPPLQKPLVTPRLN